MAAIAAERIVRHFELAASSSSAALPGREWDML
jgi:hypothetical protein